jgi:hypothetical protein
MTAEPDLEVFYLAGLFDGDGHVGTSWQKGRLSGTQRISLEMKCREPVRRFADYFGLKMHARPRDGATYYSVQIGAREKVFEILLTLHPYLFEKRAQSERTIASHLNRDRSPGFMAQDVATHPSIEETMNTVAGWTQKQREHWAAGMFEAEGCIVTSEVKVQIQYWPVVYALCDSFGGNVSINETRADRRACWRLYNREKVHSFLTTVGPLLCGSKLRQATLWINYFVLVTRTPRRERAAVTKHYATLLTRAKNRGKSSRYVGQRVGTTKFNPVWEQSDEQRKAGQGNYRPHSLD